jgi:hypothetical protein
MPACKRRRLIDIVSVLDEIKSLLNVQDYNSIKLLLAAYDKTEGQIARDQKKFTTKSTLYIKTCHYIFEQLPAPLLAISKVVAILNRIEKVTLESKTLPKDSLLSATILRIKSEMAHEITEEKNKIIQDCSQLQISMRIKSMSMILQVNADQLHACSDSCSLIENILPEYILENKYYMTLRNYCLLGAMLLFIENKKTELTTILCKTRSLRHAENVYNYSDLEKAETDIYRMIESERKAKSVKRENARVQKKSIKNLEDEITILENEHKKATDKLRSIRLENDEK